MKQKSLKTALLCLLIFFSSNVMGQNGNIEKVWVDYNVPLNQYTKGMKIHIKFSVSGMLNKQGNCSVYFFYENGNKLINYNTMNRAPDGHISIGRFFVPPYANTSYDDFVIEVPSTEFGFLGENGYNLKFCIQISDNYGNAIVQSNYSYFALNGGGSNHNQNNYSTTTTKGSGNCTLCNGTGQTKCSCNNGYNMFYPGLICGVCNGTTQTYCRACSGTGFNVQQANEEFIKKHPELIFYDGGGNSGGGSGSSSSSSSPCRCCGGTGKGTDQITYSTNYTGNSNDRYCSKCGRTSPAHTHHEPICKCCYGRK